MEGNLFNFIEHGLMIFAQLEINFEKRVFRKYENQKLDFGLIFQMFSLYFNSRGTKLKV